MIPDHTFTFYAFRDAFLTKPFYSINFGSTKISEWMLEFNLENNPKKLKRIKQYQFFILANIAIRYFNFFSLIPLSLTMSQKSILHNKENDIPQLGRVALHFPMSRYMIYIAISKVRVFGIC